MGTTIFHIITGLKGGGAEAVLYRLCARDKVYEHRVVSLMDSGDYGDLLEQAGVPVYCLNMPQGRLTLGGLWRLWRLLLKERPNLVQTWMYHADLVGGVLARLAGVPAVCWGIRHTTLLTGATPRSTMIVAQTCARISRWVPHIIVSCAHESVRVHKLLGYAAEKFVVIPNGFDLSCFTPNATVRERLRAQWKIDDEINLIGMVARFDLQKDHANLIAALERLVCTGNKFCCVLVGTNVDKGNKALVDAIEAAGLKKKIRLLGRREDVPAVMNALDLHVLSSSFGEAFPNVIAEAMACGTPCVTTEVGDAALIVGNTGWVVPPRDPDALADALGRALAARSDPIGWSARCNASREHVLRHFDIELMVESYRGEWSRVLQAISKKDRALWQGVKR